MHEEFADEAVVIVKRLAEEGYGDIPEDKTNRKRKGNLKMKGGTC